MAAAAEKGDSEMQGDEDLKNMMRRIMGMMQAMKRDMNDVKDDMGHTRAINKEAQPTARAAMQAVALVQEKIADINNNMITKTSLPAIVKDMDSNSLCGHG
jgi:Sec-independent protein translocase protein TatA